MKNNTGRKVFNKITLYLFMLLGIGIIGTFMTDYLVSINWFNDYSKIEAKYGDPIKEHFYWGARHYWYNWGVSLLFILNIARLIFEIDLIGKEKQR